MFYIGWFLASLCTYKIGGGLIFFNGISALSAGVMAAVALGVMHGSSFFAMTTFGRRQAHIQFRGENVSKMAWHLVGIAVVAGAIMAALGLAILFGFEKETWRTMHFSSGDYGYRPTGVWVALLMAAPPLLHGLINAGLLSGAAQRQKNHQP